jgi:hypothetical protein
MLGKEAFRCKWQAQIEGTRDLMTPHIVTKSGLA